MLSYRDIPASLQRKINSDGGLVVLGKLVANISLDNTGFSSRDITNDQDFSNAAGCLRARHAVVQPGNPTTAQKTQISTLSYREKRKALKDSLTPSAKHRPQAARPYSSRPTAGSGDPVSKEVTREGRLAAMYGLLPLA